MPGFLRQVFGGRRTADSSPDAEATSTVRDSAEAESASRLKPIASEQFTAPGGRRRASQPDDTGPWFIGKTVGEIYQIRGVLGRGGMGIVYRAFDTATQGDIAVKVQLEDKESAAPGVFQTTVNRISIPVVLPEESTSPRTRRRRHASFHSSVPCDCFGDGGSDADR